MNTCDIKLDFEIKHEGGHYLKLKFNWISINPTTNEISYPVVDSGYLRDWTLMQIEGEEPAPLDTSDNFATNQPKGGKAMPKKAAPAKGAKTVALEEITDDRPRTVKFKHDCAE